MFPTEESLMQTCSKGFPEFQSQKSSVSTAGKGIQRALSGEMPCGSNKPRSEGAAKPRKPITSERRTKQRQSVAPYVTAEEPVIREVVEEEEATRDVVPASGIKPTGDQYANASLGMGYFFGAGEVSKEIEDLLLKYQNYTYGSQP